MNALGSWSLTIFGATLVAMAGVVAYDLWSARRRTVRLAPQVTITTDQPLTAEDVAAIQHLLTHVVGTDEAAALMPDVIAAVAVHAAKNIDNDLRELGDAS